MDDVLRRRLVGAAVLLAFAFVIASLLPDPERASRGTSGNVTYDLRTGAAIGGTEPEARPPAEVAVEVPPSPRPALKVDETLGVAPGAWYLQIGSFESQSNARKVLQTLYGAGLPAVIHSVTSGKKLWYRVRVGPYADEPAALRGLELVRKQGYPLAKVVRPETPAPTAAPGAR